MVIKRKHGMTKRPTIVLPHGAKWENFPNKLSLPYICLEHKLEQIYPKNKFINFGKVTRQNIIGGRNFHKKLT